MVTVGSDRIAMCGCSGAAPDKVFAAEHDAVEDLAEDRSLEFSQRVDENGNRGLGGLAGVGYLTDLSRAE